MERAVQRVRVYVRESVAQRRYPINSLILMFFTFSGIGWCWEVIYHLYLDHMFINRGVMHGPWLPIYGTAGLLIIILLHRFANRPFITVAMIILVSSLIEYVTGWVLELLTGNKWWDYTGYFMNINGRVCAEASLLFAFGGIAGVYLLAPILDSLFQKIPMTISTIVCVILVAIFLVDFVCSIIYPNTGFGITEGLVKMAKGTATIPVKMS